MTNFRRKKGGDLFLITILHTVDYPDINPVVSAHTECVVGMQRKHI